MARKSRKHAPKSPKIQTAEGWRRQVLKKTGKKVHVLPGGSHLGE